MALAANHPHRFGWSRFRSSDDAAVAEPRVRVRPLGASFSGLLALLVGTWAAIAVYIGPYFGYRPTTVQTWTWNTQNWMLHLAPGAAAAVAGLILLAVGPSRRTLLGGALALPGLLLLVAGGWFVVGPAAWPLIESGPAFAGATTHSAAFANQIGTTLGPGVVLAILAGMALKAGLARPIIEPLPEPAPKAAEQTPTTSAVPPSV